VPLVAAEKYDVLNSCQMLRLVGGLQFLSWIKDLEMIMTAFTVSCYGIVLLGWLVMIAFFFFAVMAVMLFKETDPYRFGSIPSRFVLCWFVLCCVGLWSVSYCADCLLCIRHVVCRR